jgi:hypothetical protein
VNRILISNRDAFKNDIAYVPELNGSPKRNIREKLKTIGGR